MAAATTSEPSELSSSSSSPIEAPRKYHFFQNVEYVQRPNEQGKVAIIRFDNPDKAVNTISFAMKDEAKLLWDSEIHNDTNISAVVFSSGKPMGFIAGADIGDIKSIEDKRELTGIIEDGLKFFQKMKSKGVPLVCAINGPALGGGLEWALWCDYRVCSDAAQTKLGLPEVKLGLLPGFGGTQNLHPLVGLQEALGMMLQGKEVRAKKAKKIGLVDMVVAPQSVEKVAIDSAFALANKSLKIPKKKKSWMNWALEDTSIGRNLIFKKTKEMVDKNTGGAQNYPSPYKIMDCVQHGLEHSSGDEKYKFEREQFAQLADTTQAKGLIGIFEGMTSLKKHNFGETSQPIQNVAVLGAGLMGAGIAQVTAEKGYTTLLKDKDDAGIARGEAYIQENWGKKVKRKRMTKYQHNINTSNIVPLTDDSVSWQKHFGQADLVIEAVFEDLNLKRKIVADMEAVTPSHCVFATNTSAIPICDIAEGAQRPENIIGMHYFSPVPQMPLLEIIPHEGTADHAKAAACEVGTKQGKTCIAVKDVPGFYVNRCLGPFLVEVSALIRDGASLEALDKAMKNFGMPVGPITLADEVGVDVTSKVATFLSNADLGVRMEGGDVSVMSNMIEKGWLGKKAGQGFYTYNGKKKTINADVKAYIQQYVKKDLGLKEEEIQNRIVSRFVNEAVKCLEDGIIADPVVGDIGLVFGTGFAPFTGGPFRYLDAYGADKYVGVMEGFAAEYGPQFEPCQLLKDHAASGKKFHSD
uniref:enoyl-CoA hydratase n=1 Tax=Leptocylindrus danicus TaxID=163516 RepID=A0A7S2NZB3_9STRA